MAAFDHLLGQHPNARRRLRAHPGRLVRVGMESGPVPVPGRLQVIWLRITEQGTLAPAEPGEPDVQLLLKPSVTALADLLRDGPAALAPHLRVEGDVLLAGLLGELILDLRWDAEDDLSRWIGDVPARRVAKAVAGADTALRDAGARIGRQAARVAAQATADGSLPLAGREAFERLQADISDLGRRLDAIERDT
ncbi:MAG: hypothetical protein R3E68_02640 [Burkholderiaceae bacterium]